MAQSAPSPLTHPSPPSPSSDDHHTVIVIVFISFGCVFLLAFLVVALFCFLNKKNKKRATQESEVVRFDEHKKIKEGVVEGPRGAEAVVLSVEDDVHIDGAIIKDETCEKRKPFSSSSNVHESDIIHVHGNEKVKGDIVELGPHGSKAVVLKIEDEFQVDGETRKNDRYGKDSNHHH